MTCVLLLCFSIILLVCLQFKGQGESFGVEPCAKTVVVESTEIYNYLANVTFKVPIPHQGIWVLSMTTDESFAFFGGWGIKVQVDEKTHSFVKITSLQSQSLNTGDKISFRFRLYWNRNSTTWPKVKRIIWENHLICESTSRKKNRSHKSRKDQAENLVSKHKYWVYQ